MTPCWTRPSRTGGSNEPAPTASPPSSPGGTAPPPRSSPRCAARSREARPSSWSSAGRRTACRTQRTSCTCSPWTATGSAATLSSAAAAGRPRCWPRWRPLVTTETAPRIAASLDELVAGATERTEIRTSDAKSGARFERLVVDGQKCFLKVLSPDDDWIMRVTGNTTNWEFTAWRAGLYAETPAVIDHTVLGMALEGNRLSVLMSDCGDDLVPPGDDPVPSAHHADFLDAMAAMHAHFLGWRDELGLQDLSRRWLFFAPETIAPELEVADVPGPIAVAHQGWGLLPERAPRLHELVRSVHRDPAALSDALRSTPLTFVAGDWKFGNVGHRPDGRTVLLDWAYPGAAPPCWDLTWYVALNRARLPESKEATIARYRERLEAHGVATDGWWDRQLGLSLVGMAAVFAWEKAVGDQAELDWWERAALDGARWL